MGACKGFVKHSRGAGLPGMFGLHVASSGALLEPVCTAWPVSPELMNNVLTPFNKRCLPRDDVDYPVGTQACPQH